MTFSYISSLNTGRYNPQIIGDSNSALIIGGEDSPGGRLNTTEEYNGTSWSYDNNINTARWRHVGQGTPSAGLIEMGESTTYFSNLSSSEEYNGIVWSYGGNVNQARYWAGGSGTSSAAWNAGGSIWSDSTRIAQNTCETYDGTTWTYINNLNSNRDVLSGGTENINSAFINGGYYNQILNTTETYNGTSWNYKSNMLIGYKNLMNFGSSLTLTMRDLTSQYYDKNQDIYLFADNLNGKRRGAGASGENINYGIVGAGYEGPYGSGTYLISAEIFSLDFYLVGQVRDALTIEPLPNAYIRIGNRSTYSSAQGNYTFVDLPTQQYNITTTLTNYYPDVYSINITQNESYNPFLYPILNPTLNEANLSNILEYNEEPLFEMHIEKNINNSIIIDISKKSEVYYNFRILAQNESEKNEIYSWVGYKIKTLNLFNIENISNVYLISAAFQKKIGNQSFWIGNLKFIKTY